MLNDKQIKEIKKRMIDKDLEAKDIAEHLNVSKGYMSMVMNKRESLSYERFREMCDFIGVTSTWLMAQKEEK